MPSWRCTTCAHLSSDQAACPACGGSTAAALPPSLPPSRTLTNLFEAFRWQASNAFLLQSLAEGEAEPERRDLYLRLAEAEGEAARQALLQAGVLPEGALKAVLQALVAARVEAFPRWAEEAEAEGMNEVSTFLKWSASRKALGASALARLSL